MPAPSKRPGGRKENVAAILRGLSGQQPVNASLLGKEPAGWKKKVLGVLPAGMRHRLRMRSGLSARIAFIRVLSSQIPELEKGFRRSLRRQPELKADLEFHAPEIFLDYIREYEKLLVISRRSAFEREYRDLSREAHLFSLPSETLADLEGQSRTLRDASRLFEKRRKQALEYGFRDPVFRNSLARSRVIAGRWHRLFALEQKARQRLQESEKAN